MKLTLKPLALMIGLLPALVPAIAMASSHREAPFISTMPQVDASDFYMFMSYEPGRDGYVTLVANYNPLQNPASGPNFHVLDPNAVYDFNVDSNGDGKANTTFRFKFTNTYKNLAVPAGNQTIAEPLLNVGPISANNTSYLNRTETYTVQMLTNGQSGSGPMLKNAANGSTVFTKPVDNIGNKSIADYKKYASNYVYNVTIPGCSKPGRVTVGQHKDGFVAYLGGIFDLVNLNPLGPRDANKNTLTGLNVDTLALEVPASCLGATKQQPILGAWTTASIPRYRYIGNNGEPYNYADYVQVSRLGAPLVNELVIGLKDKDKFNGSQPSNDGQFLKYVTNPTAPVLLNVLFNTKVPGTPRNDLVAAFLTGVKGLNQPPNVSPAEELRLNTSIAPTAPAQQNDLGVLGGDNAGFPNGRRPYDDVVDITLRVAEGALCGFNSAMDCGSMTSDPNHGAPFTDGARSPGATFATEHVTGQESPLDSYFDAFPYLATPIPGAGHSQ